MLKDAFKYALSTTICTFFAHGFLTNLIRFYSVLEVNPKRVSFQKYSATGTEKSLAKSH